MVGGDETVKRSRSDGPRRAATTRGDRIAPLALGLGMLMWAVGDVVLTVESRHGAEPVSPSLADLFYLLFFPCVKSIPNDPSVS